jgi:hypothetical protein
VSSSGAAAEKAEEPALPANVRSDFLPQHVKKDLLRKQQGSPSKRAPSPGK